jgi:type IV secretion system protein VirB3
MMAEASSRAQQLETAPLYLAATRESLVPWLGVPYRAGVVLIAAAGLIVAFLHNPAWLLLLLPVWLGLVILTRHDANALRIADLWSRTSLVSLDSASWGGASPAPFPLRRAKHDPPRGMTRAV